jgi:nucleoid-associated protein YgaU
MRTVTVAPGDSLWTLAAAALRPGAGDARVDRAWRDWYSANRRTIGPDPDLLLPGQRLIAPDATERTSS